MTQEEKADQGTVVPLFMVVYFTLTPFAGDYLDGVYFVVWLGGYDKSLH